MKVLAMIGAAVLVAGMSWRLWLDERPASTTELVSCLGGLFLLAAVIVGGSCR